MHADGRIPICKACIFKQCFEESTGEVNKEELKKILRLADRPYIESLYQSSVSQYDKIYSGKEVPSDNKKRIVGLYFKNIQSLPQYIGLNWDQGFEIDNKKRTTKNQNLVYTPNVQSQYKIKADVDDMIYELDDDKSFEVTSDMVTLFGGGFKKAEYRAMWNKYQFLKKNYSDITNLHTESLVTYVRFKVKEEDATAKGDADGATKWNAAATKAADKAKINPSQLTQSDLQGGVNSFSELIQMVEQSVDIIPILPRFKYRPNDAIDFNIWCIVNYLRDLEGKTPCEYKDVYKFYDDRKREYIDQYGDPYGIFESDTTERNRESIRKFITLPKDYDNDGVLQDG